MSRSTNPANCSLLALPRGGVELYPCVQRNTEQRHKLLYIRPLKDIAQTIEQQRRQEHICGSNFLLALEYTQIWCIRVKYRRLPGVA